MSDLRQIASLAVAVAALVLCYAASAQMAPAAKGAVSAAGAPAADGADALFARWDTNHDKVLSRDEFRAGWTELRAQASAQRLHAQFAALDADKNGCLSSIEYVHMELIAKGGKSAPPMSQFDTEKNQCLDFKEYVNTVSFLLSHQVKP